MYTLNILKLTEKHIHMHEWIFAWGFFAVLFLYDKSALFQNYGLN